MRNFIEGEIIRKELVIKDKINIPLDSCFRFDRTRCFLYRILVFSSRNICLQFAMDPSYDSKNILG